MFNFVLLKLEYCSLQDKTWDTYNAASGSTIITEKRKNRQIDKLFKINMDISSIHFSLSVVSDSLRPHGLQHARPPCPSPTPGVHSNSRPLSQWCHPAISSSVVPFCCLQSFPASGSFQMSQFFASGDQNIGVLHAHIYVCLSSQGYGFSCGHVWMWELDCEEDWVRKNWCF